MNRLFTFAAEPSFIPSVRFYKSRAKATGKGLKPVKVVEKNFLVGVMFMEIKLLYFFPFPIFFI